MPRLAQPDPIHAALAYAARGWSVLPLHTPEANGCSCRHHDCPSAGKHPRTRHGVADATTDTNRIRRWWTAWPTANIGLVTGSPLIVIDVDGDTGRTALRGIQRDRSPMPATLAAITGRGIHLYFTHHSPALGNSTGRLGAGLDVRGEGGYVVAPPSRHADGDRYHWANGLAPAPLPEWITEHLKPPIGSASATPAPPTGGPRHRRYLDSAIRRELRRIESAQRGTRNDTLNRSAFRLAQLVGDGPAAQLEQLLLTAALASGLGAREARATIASALSAGREHRRG